MDLDGSGSDLDGSGLAGPGSPKLTLLPSERGFHCSEGFVRIRGSDVPGPLVPGSVCFEVLVPMVPIDPFV